MTSDRKPLDPSQIQAINDQASVWMKRGIRLMSDVQPAALSEALVCFDRALELRRHLPADEVPILRYGLAACWLNKADALVRLGDIAQLPAALRAYDEGIALVRALPLFEDPRFPRRLAIALQNRALALQVQNPGGAEAVAALTEALAVLHHDDAAPISDRGYLLAAVTMNLARAHAARATPESMALARISALRAIALVTDMESNDADAAEVGLKARHLLCQTIAGRLSETDATRPAPMPDDVHEATDAVDEGLALVRQWEKKQVTRFRSIAYDLFRFGARVYAKYQPQFLNEFIHENVDPGRSSSAYVGSAEMRSAAEEARRLSGRTSR